MKKRLSKLLRLLADKIDPITIDQLEEQVKELKPSQGTVIEVDDNPLQWAPKQSGNVIIAEPMLITKDRLEHGRLSKVSKPF